MQPTLRVRVTFTVEVDTAAWMEAYGLRPGPDTLRDIREALNENAEATTIDWLDRNGFRPEDAS